MWTGCAGSFDSRNQRWPAGRIDEKRVRLPSWVVRKMYWRPGTSFRKRNAFPDACKRKCRNVKRLRVKKIVTQCPHCLNALKNEYPDLGGNYEVLHHSQFLKNFVKKKTASRKNDRNVTYHDPCYLGRYNQEYDSPRNHKWIGFSVTEMQRHRNESFAVVQAEQGCGWKKIWAPESMKNGCVRLKKQVHPGHRCPFCMTMLSDGIAASGNSEKLETWDVAELMLESIKTWSPASLTRNEIRLSKANLHFEKIDNTIFFWYKVRLTFIQKNGERSREATRVAGTAEN